MSKSIIKKQSDKVLIKTLREIAEALESLAYNISAVCNGYELPDKIDEMRRIDKSGKVKSISTAWLQRKFKIGYAHAAYLLDILEKEKIVKRDS